MSGQKIFLIPRKPVPKYDLKPALNFRMLLCGGRGIFLRVYFIINKTIWQREKFKRTFYLNVIVPPRTRFNFNLDERTKKRRCGVMTVLGLGKMEGSGGGLPPFVWLNEWLAAEVGSKRGESQNKQPTMKRKTPRSGSRLLNCISTGRVHTWKCMNRQSFFTQLKLWVSQNPEQASSENLYWFSAHLSHTRHCGAKGSHLIT